jgi:hypothetical protein
LKGALAAETEEFQFVGDVLEAVILGDSFFEFLGEAGINLGNCRASRANEVVMMAEAVLGHELKTSGVIAEIEAFDQPHVFQQVQGPVDGG